MRSALIVTIIISILMSGCAGPQFKLFPDATDPLKEFTLEGNGTDKILLIPVRGVISDNPKRGLLGTSPSMVQQLVSQLQKAERDKNIKAVLLKINSPGGSVTISDILYHEISSFKQRTGVKITVSMMDIGASGAYYLSLPADRIMAHPTTQTGSIGVIFLQPRVVGLMDKLGLTIDVRKFGKNKDMGSPFRTSIPEEDRMFQSTVDKLGERFISLVKKHRKMEPKALAEISTARLFLADEALKLGLIDKIGYLSDAINEAKIIAGLPKDARVVVYRRTEYPEDNLYNVAGSASNDPRVSLISIELPEMINLTSGFYYIWPGAIGTGE